eukprot:6350968-Ditylum_brightwellii.AAC.1
MPFQQTYYLHALPPVPVLPTIMAMAQEHLAMQFGPHLDSTSSATSCILPKPVTASKLQCSPHCP